MMNSGLWSLSGWELGVKLDVSNIQPIIQEEMEMSESAKLRMRIWLYDEEYGKGSYEVKQITEKRKKIIEQINVRQE